MKRTHAFAIAIVVAFSAVAGTFAALRTTRLGANAQATTHVSTAQIVNQNRAIDRAERALIAELRKKPPAVPPLPVASHPAPIAAAASAPQTVIYHRPPPVVHVIHRHGGEQDGREGPDGGGMDD